MSDSCRVFIRPLRNESIILLSLTCVMSVYEGKNCLILCSVCPPWKFSPISDHLLSLGAPPASECTKALQEHPEQTAHAEKLDLVYSFL